MGIRQQPKPLPVVARVCIAAVSFGAVALLAPYIDQKQIEHGYRDEPAPIEPAPSVAAP